MSNQEEKYVKLSKKTVEEFILRLNLSTGKFVQSELAESDGDSLWLKQAVLAFLIVEAIAKHAVECFEEDEIVIGVETGLAEKIQEAMSSYEDYEKASVARSRECVEELQAWILETFADPARKRTVREAFEKILANLPAVSSQKDNTNGFGKEPAKREERRFDAEEMEVRSTLAVSPEDSPIPHALDHLEALIEANFKLAHEEKRLEELLGGGEREEETDPEAVLEEAKRIFQRLSPFRAETFEMQNKAYKSTLNLIAFVEERLNRKNSNGQDAPAPSKRD